MKIDDGEFIVLVGPSGCGKSTTLRMVAGLEEISAGELYIDDKLVNDVQPKDRDIAMVFQNYALYPHMTVYENMAFGLELRHVPRPEIHSKVMWAADILGLKEYLDRKPKAMSGGQRQRVALGRAILRNPKVMLLDEPLSNLDAKLRSQMRSEISKLHQSLKTTFIYVTHDQVEAMTLGTRVVVMKLGNVQQVDSPKNLYDFPVNKFVAGFIGTPQMNFFDVTLKRDGDRVILHFLDCQQEDMVAEYSDIIKAKGKYLKGSRPVIMGVRCEAISVEEADIAKGDNLVDVKVSHFEELGNETLIYGDINQNAKTFGDSHTSIIIKATSTHGFKPGDVVKARIDVTKAHFFDKETENTILPRIPGENVLPISVKDGVLSILGKQLKIASAIDIVNLPAGNMISPIDALVLDPQGDLSARVFRIEDVDGKKLAYLENNKDTLFALVDDTVHVGDTLHFFIRLSKATFENDREKVLVEPLEEFDDLTSNFVNYKTAFGKTQNPEFQSILKERVQKVEVEFAQKKHDLQAEQNKELGRIDTSNIQAVRSKNQTDIEVAKRELTAKIADLKRTYEKDLSKAKSDYAAKQKEIKRSVKRQYAQMLAKEKADYIEAKETNRDKDAVRTAKQTYDAFREVLPQTQQNDLLNRLNAAGFDYDTVRSGIVARYNREKDEAQIRFEEMKKEKTLEAFPEENVRTRYEAAFNKLEADYQKALLNAQYLFFFDYDGFYQLVPDNITNKIIEGLGSKVFTKTFRIKVPHNGYEMTRDAKRGIKAEVEDIVDYFTESFYLCRMYLYNQYVRVFVLKNGDDVKKGETVYLRPDLVKTQISETALNIRLY
jgi:multiple sugar transport system ATP-binding protein